MIKTAYIAEGLHINVLKLCVLGSSEESQDASRAEKFSITGSSDDDNKRKPKKKISLEKIERPRGDKILHSVFRE